jgi:hypothetical protein
LIIFLSTFYRDCFVKIWLGMGAFHSYCDRWLESGQEGQCAQVDRCRTSIWLCTAKGNFIITAVEECVFYSIFYASFYSNQNLKPESVYS